MQSRLCTYVLIIKEKLYFFFSLNEVGSYLTLLSTVRLRRLQIFKTLNRFYSNKLRSKYVKIKIKCSLKLNDLKLLVLCRQNPLSICYLISSSSERSKLIIWVKKPTFYKKNSCKAAGKSSTATFFN